MAITPVNITSANSTSVTIPATTAGNCLVVCVMSHASSQASVSGITLGGSADNFGSLATAHSGGTVSFADSFIWADPNCAGGQTSVAISGSNLAVGTTTGGVVVFEISGLPATIAALLDQLSTGGATTGTSLSSGSTPTTSYANEIWIGCAEAVSTITGPGAWTNTAPTGGHSVAGYQVVSSTGTATYTATQSVTDPWSAAVVALQAAIPVDFPQIQPGPTWLGMFKPGMPRPRPSAPPSGPYYGNLPNPSDQGQIQPGPTWLGMFKPGMPRPRPSLLPPGNNVAQGGVTAAAPSLSGTVYLPNLVPDQPQVNPGPTWLSLYKPGQQPHRPLGLGDPQFIVSPIAASGGVTAAAASLSGALYATNPYDVPDIQPGPAWLRHFKPGLAKPLPFAPDTGPPAAAGAVTAAAPSISGTVVVPVPDLPLNPGPTWLRHFKPGLGRPQPFIPTAQFIGAAGGVTAAAAALNATGINATLFPQNILGLRAEILINGTWTDVTTYVYQRNPLVITRGLPDETQQVTPVQLTLTLDNRDGRFSPRNPGGAYYPYLTRNIQFRLSVTGAASRRDTPPYAGYRFWGEVSSWPPRWDPTGSDVYCDIVVSGVLRRYVQGAPLGSTLRRYYTNLSGTFAPYAYWPCEDGSKATEIASALPSVGAMTFTGTPGFASDSAFGGSDALPTISSSVWHGQTGAAADPPGSGSITQNSPGTYHFTVPPGVTALTNVSCIGGGAAGGDTDGTTGGGGGGGGEQAAESSIAVTAGGTYTYVVGAGGGTVAGANGSGGNPSTLTGDSVTVTAHGGLGGIKAGSGGSGGAGSTNTTHHHGGAGAHGSASTTSTYGSSVAGSSGAFGIGNFSGGYTTSDWTAPAGVTSVDVTGQGAGGGGGGGGFFGYGGAGGGGGGYSRGTIDVTPGNTYTFHAGNGGPGGVGNTGSLTNCSGGPGGDSFVNGDTTSVDGHSGGGGVATTSIHNQGGQGGAGNNSFGGQGGAGNNGSNTGGGGGGGDSGQDGGSSGASSSGRSPGGSTGAGAGGGWGGPSGTTGGATAGSYGGGGGGGGSSDSGHGVGGGGGGPGFIEWTWTVSGAPAGGGGGASGGTSAVGNPGGTNGTGGSAVTGGGAGGTTGGSPAGGQPGGGGAGAVPSSSFGSGSSPGNGAAGQVKFSWNGGTTSPVAADIIRFCLHVDSAGAADGAVLLRAQTYGDVQQLDLVYHTGGKLELIGYNASSSVVIDSGAVSFGADGTPLYVDIELTANGANANWLLTAIKPGAGSVVASASGTVSSVSVGFVSDIYVDPAGTVTDSGTSIGQITVQTYADTLANLSKIVNGYAGELAADRISRLCAEQGIGFRLVGTNTDTPQMGPQQDDTFVNVLQSCADFDRGQLFETRDQFGIGYRTRVNLQGQNAAVTADYTQATLAGSLQPVDDDQLVRNDITVTRNGGASATAKLTSGPESIQAPPNGVGDYTQSLTVQAYSDSQLANLVAWMLTVGTVSEYRYPTIEFDLARSEIAALFAELATLDIGDYVQVINPPSFLQVLPISQLAWGFKETLNNYTWTIEINAVPESPYSQGNPPTW